MVEYNEDGTMARFSQDMDFSVTPISDFIASLKHRTPEIPLAPVVPIKTRREVGNSALSGAALEISDRTEQSA